MSDNETQAPEIIACAIAVIVIPTLAVIMRFWSRTAAGELGFWWDDWAILATLVTMPLLFSHLLKQAFY